MMTETVSHVCFSVDGNWLADFARTRLREGAWDYALNLLVESLQGLTTDQAIAILKGEATLTGSSSDADGIGYEVLTDGVLAAQIKNDMDYLYRGLFKDGNQIWRPYAVVSGWCEDDYRFAQSFTAPYNLVGYASHRDNGYLTHFRSLYYADDAHRDMMVCIETVVLDGAPVCDVLCERYTDTVPFWYKLPTNRTIEVCQAAAAKLPVRGAHLDGWGEIDTTRQIEVCNMETGKWTTRDCTPEDDEIAKALLEAPAVEEARPEVDVEAKPKQTKEELRTLWVDILEMTNVFLASNPTDLKEVRENDKIFEKGVDVLHKQIIGDEWDRVEEIRDEFTALNEQLMGARVREQAEKMGGFFDLPLFSFKGGERKPYGPRSFLKVPLHPFIHWAVRYFDFEAHGKKRPEWPQIAGSGWKMYNDDAYHTDWMLGAGVPLKETYNHDDDSFGDVVRMSAYIKAEQIVKEITGHTFMTLAKGRKDYLHGEIVKPGPGQRVPPGSIAVVPNAGPDYQLAMETACSEGEYGPGAIICDTGGKLAHLAVVGREFNCTVIMLPNATSMYRDYQRVAIDLKEGVITLKV